jgi:hypothetical protein
MPDYFTSLDDVVNALARKRDRAQRMAFLLHAISWPGLIVLACFYGGH